MIQAAGTALETLPVLYLLVSMLLGGALLAVSGLLTPTGGVLAGLMAFAFAGAFGWPGLVPPLVFLATGSLWTRWPGGSRKTDRTRSARQELANGLVPTLFALAEWIRPHAPFELAVVGSLAAATADTWATEWGRALGGRPLSLRTLTRVPAGRSGAVSAVGLAASLAGAAALAGAAGAAGLVVRADLATVILAGMAGSLADSAAGAWIQGIWERKDGRLDEAPGEASRLARGVPWLDNDGVNVLCTLTGAAVALTGA